MRSSRDSCQVRGSLVLLPAPVACSRINEVAAEEEDGVGRRKALPPSSNPKRATSVVVALRIVWVGVA